MREAPPVLDLFHFQSCTSTFVPQCVVNLATVRSVLVATLLISLLRVLGALRCVDWLEKD